MPAYKATVIGENFEFVVDEEPQLLDFSRTLYVDADDESSAQQAALAQVRQELLAQALLDDAADPLLTIDELCLDDGPGKHELLGDFIWYFADDEELEEDA